MWHINPPDPALPTSTSFLIAHTRNTDSSILLLHDVFVPDLADSQRLIDSDRCLFIARCPGCVLVYNDRNYQPGKYI
uniref:Uncharacterized protein n=1 Tax=Oryza punctata TaxID=4537 RepID=A0A0E0K233_ORYPU